MIWRQTNLNQDVLKCRNDFWTNTFGVQMDGSKIEIWMELSDYSKQLYSWSDIHGSDTYAKWTIDLNDVLYRNPLF